jgi:hypothetical protein
LTLVAGNERGDDKAKRLADAEGADDSFAIVEGFGDRAPTSPSDSPVLAFPMHAPLR